jgi:hypothetical protein
MINLPKLFSQRDPKWKMKKLGTSSLTLGTAGCTLTDLSMLLNFYGIKSEPDELNEQLKASGGFYMGSLIVWSAFVRRFNFKSYKRSLSYNNWDVWTQINIYGRPVLVEVKAPVGVPGERHWVIFLGNQKAADPFTGTIESTSKYTPTGYCVLVK